MSLTWMSALLTLQVPVLFEYSAGRAQFNLPKHLRLDAAVAFDLRNKCLHPKNYSSEFDLTERGSSQKGFLLELDFLGVPGVSSR